MQRQRWLKARLKRAMQFLPRETRYWMPELATALEAIAKAVAGHEPTAERLEAAAPHFVDAVPGHHVAMLWYYRGYLNEPDIDEPGKLELAITIDGERPMVGWLIPAADPPRVLAQALAD